MNALPVRSFLALALAVTVGCSRDEPPPAAPAVDAPGAPPVAAPAPTADLAALRPLVAEIAAYALAVVQRRPAPEPQLVALGRRPQVLSELTDAELARVEPRVTRLELQLGWRDAKRGLQARVLVGPFGVRLLQVFDQGVRDRIAPRGTALATAWRPILAALRAGTLRDLALDVGDCADPTIDAACRRYLAEVDLGAAPRPADLPLDQAPSGYEIKTADVVLAAPDGSLAAIRLKSSASRQPFALEVRKVRRLRSATPRAAATGPAAHPILHLCDGFARAVADHTPADRLLQTSARNAIELGGAAVERATARWGPASPTAMLAEIAEHGDGTRCRALREHLERSR